MGMSTDPTPPPAGDLLAEYEWVVLGQTSVFGTLLIRWYRSVERAEQAPHDPVLTASAEGVTVGHLVPLHSIPDAILAAAKDAWTAMATGRHEQAVQHITHHYERARDGFELVKGVTP